MAGLARDAGLTHLIAPVRPTLKDLYPAISIEHYVRWTRPDRAPFDPWMRVHTPAGCLGFPTPCTSPVPSATGSHGLACASETGDYVFRAGLTIVHIDRDNDAGEYWEPNIWIIHRVSSQKPG